MSNYDFSGWATKVNLKCSDGRVIKKDAFKVNDGTEVPLVWNHDHLNPDNILGHALLENRPEGIYAYGVFNDTVSGQQAKALVKNKDISALSIWANELKQKGDDVVHGVIRELSMVLAGSNPGAFIDNILAHGETTSEEAFIFTGEEIVIEHSTETSDSDLFALLTDEQKEIVHAMIKKNETPDEPEKEKPDEETVEEVFNTLNEKQKNVVYAMITEALNDGGNNNDPEGGDNMSHSVFEDNGVVTEKKGELSHAAQAEIIGLAKTANIGSLQLAMKTYAAEHNATLAHGIDEIEKLFPDYVDVYPGGPELITRDQSWVSAVMAGVHKSPISRIRTRQTDIRPKDIRAKGYKKGNEKTEPINAKLLSRTTDPQTVYRKDSLHRDDIIDITEFDVVEYQYNIMRLNLNEELAQAIMIGDGRDDNDEDKISTSHIRPIWTDADLYTIKALVDFNAAKTAIQGTDTSKRFGDEYIWAEAIITAALHAREKYKGSGSLDFWCTPRLLNTMLLARDLNGRRIYDSKADLAKALDVNAIHTAEQFEGLVRTEGSGSSAKNLQLMGIFADLNDYRVGATKGGEITRFNQFDIDFNKEKYLIETRCSGALTKVYSAIVLEEDVTNGGEEGQG